MPRDPKDVSLSAEEANARRIAEADDAKGGLRQFGSANGAAGPEGPKGEKGEKGETGGIGPEGSAALAGSFWRDVFEAGMVYSPALAAGTYGFARDKEIAAEETALPLVATYIDPADYAVTGKTTKYRVRANLFTNATAPGATFTVGLYKITASAGATGKVKLTKELVASTTVTFTTPAASSMFNGSSAEIAAPAAGYYMFQVVQSGAPTAANAQGVIDARLQVKNV